MPDHTERRKSPRTQETRERELLTLDYHGREVKTRVLAEDRAAVRAAVLAEVREKVERYMEEGCGCGCDADDHADAFNGILAALTALEATDGN